MRTLKTLLAMGLALILAVACSPTGRYAIEEFGSFHIGGREVTLSNLPVREVVLTRGASPVKIDLNGDFEVEQMYVQYLIPADQKSRYPLLMWHGGGLTGVTWETKPDGNPGWMQYFLKAGHPVYVSDAVERGRASWARYPEVFATEPVFRSKKEAWELFRIGPLGSYSTDPSKRRAFPGQQFPLSAFDQLCKQSVPRWSSNDGPTQAAYDRLIQKIGSSVVMVHSQGGNFGFHAALAAPEKVKAVVAIEPTGAPKPGPQLEKLKNTPILIIWGDYWQENARWRMYAGNVKAFADDLRSKGGKVEWVDLPRLGISGNTHMLMMDTNSDQIAQVVQDWMAKNNLMR